ncbi:MAG: Hsp20 family protein [Candidatus Hydrogenedens sp.]|nr:Hsp20 family protein [Candidatus Hydrogenedens sp.]
MTDLFQRMGWADPFRELRRFQEDLNRAFDTWPDLRAREFPPLNLWAGEDGVIISAELPGLGADQIQVSAHKNTLTLSGRRKPQTVDDGAVALRQELPAGAFTRTVTLPFVVDADQVSAKSDGGILIIHLPRPESDRPKRIRIATA